MEQHLQASPQQSMPGSIPGVPVAPEGVKMIYFNGFAAGVSMGDIAIPISRNGVHFATLNVSYSVAKTLGECLIDLISQLEKATGNHIMTSLEIDKATAKMRE